MHCIIFTIFLIITVIGFFLPYTNDFSKGDNTFSFKDPSVGHLIFGVIIGLLLNPKPYKWEIKTKDDDSKEIYMSYVITRITIAIVCILVFTYRNFKHVINLYDKISNIDNAKILTNNECYYPDKATFWTSSFTKQMLQLIIGIVLGISSSSIFTKEKDLRIPINDIIAGILCVLFIILIIAQQWNSKDIVSPEMKEIIKSCSTKMKEIFKADKDLNSSNYNTFDVIRDIFKSNKQQDYNPLV